MVATPRRIRRERRSTTGAIAIAANHDISTVKMTLPPSSITNRTTRPNAMTASRTSPTRQTFPGTNVTCSRSRRGTGSGVVDGAPASAGTV